MADLEVRLDSLCPSSSETCLSGPDFVGDRVKVSVVLDDLPFGDLIVIERGRDVAVSSPDPTVCGQQAVTGGLWGTDDGQLVRSEPGVRTAVAVEVDAVLDDIR